LDLSALSEGYRIALKSPATIQGESERWILVRIKSDQRGLLRTKEFSAYTTVRFKEIPLFRQTKRPWIAWDEQEDSVKEAAKGFQPTNTLPLGEWILFEHQLQPGRRASETTGNTAGEILVSKIPIQLR